MDSFKIASRASSLALAQVEEIMQGLKARGLGASYELIKIDTSGDRDKSTPLTSSPDNFFTDAIDQALLVGEADIAIHSAKDLPQKLPEGLEIFALTKCLDNKDAWVGRVHWPDLPPHAKVATSSLLRREQILRLRPDVEIVDARGSIAERLEMVKQGLVDGVVVAACALERLKLESEIKDIFPWEGQALQGQLAVVGRTGEEKLKDLFSVLDARDKKILLHCGSHPEIYRDLGPILHWPMIEIKEVSYDDRRLKEIMRAYREADMAIFTSRHAVEHFFRIFPPTDLKPQKIFAVIGRQTKEALEKQNIHAQITAKQETAEGLLEAIVGYTGVCGLKILFPRSSLPNPFLKEALISKGAVVVEITVYENIKPAKRPLPSTDIRGVIFTSPSTVYNFLTDYGIIPNHWKIFAKGPHTLKTLHAKGYTYAASLS